MKAITKVNHSYYICIVYFYKCRCKYIQPIQKQNNTLKPNELSVIIQNMV